MEEIKNGRNLTHPKPVVKESPALTALAGLRHAFFTRNYGYSKGIYATLNCGLGSNDKREHVRDNRGLCAAWLGVGSDMLINAHQVHGTNCLTVHGPLLREEGQSLPRADALVTNSPGIAVAVLTADCVPILFADAKARVVGAAHAGWRGAVAGIVSSVVKAMVALGAKPGNIAACVGPAISLVSYEVGAAFKENVLKEHKNADKFFTIPAHSEEWHFDLPGFVIEQLRLNEIETADQMPHCTYKESNDFFSFRRNTHQKLSDYGRQISAIALTP